MRIAWSLTVLSSIVNVGCGGDDGKDISMQMSLSLMSLFCCLVLIGAAQADVAVLVINATRGEFETGFEMGGQTREHAMLVRSLGKTRSSIHPSIRLSVNSSVMCTLIIWIN